MFRTLCSPFPCILIFCGLLPETTHAADLSLEEVQQKYVESIGGSARLEKIHSVRFEGTITLEDDSTRNIVVVKKKPFFARTTISEGSARFIRGYDGETAWFLKETPRGSFDGQLSSDEAEDFIRNAPLEPSLLFATENVNRQLGEIEEIQGRPCYPISIEYPDGSKTVFLLDAQNFLERRVREYNSDGELLFEVIPGKFEKFDGIMFAMQTIRRQDGKNISKMNIENVQTNVGVLNSYFEPPF